MSQGPCFFPNFRFEFVLIILNLLPLPKEVMFKRYLAKIAQLVERHLAKVEVAGSNPVFRSTKPNTFGFFYHCCRSGGIGRHAGLKIQWTEMSVRVQVPSSVQKPRQLPGFFSYICKKSYVKNVVWRTALFFRFWLWRKIYGAAAS